MFTEPSSWTEPDLPDWTAEPVLAVDTETFDPKLKKMGPGFIRGDAYVAGISVSNGSESVYAPVKHSVQNMDSDRVARWLKSIFSSKKTLLFANAAYDLESLHSFGVSCHTHDIYDVQIAEALIDEEQDRYDLDSIGKKYGTGKDTKKLNQIMSDHKIDMSKVAMLGGGQVAPYAMQDAAMLFDIYYEQQEYFERNSDLNNAVHLDMQLIPLLHKMRQRGVRVDTEGAHRLIREYEHKIALQIQLVKHESNLLINPQSSRSVAKLCEEIGVAYPRTALGNPSIDKVFLSAQEHPCLKAIFIAKKLRKVSDDFVKGIVLDHGVKGRVHPNWLQSRGNHGGEEGGTRTGRIACKRPNLTQIPARDPDVGPDIRALFLPEEGCSWVKNDYSSQEPRFTVHFAAEIGANGSADVVKAYNKDPNLDYHQYTADMIEEMSGTVVDRGPAKQINLGLTYGKGKASLAEDLGLTLLEAEKIFKAYHEGVPYVRETSNHYRDIAADIGYVSTIVGRRRNFNKYSNRERTRVVPGRQNAIDQFGYAERAFVHKALNAKVQGSASDQLKKSLLLLDSEGFDIILQVYDEIALSIDKGNDKAVADSVEIMENSIRLVVPNLVEPQIGENWNA